jgi:hypothetical protein
LEKFEQMFIESLVQQKRKGVFFSPFLRTLFTLFTFITLNVIFFKLYQNFRPHFLEQLLTYPRFLIELVSAFFLMCTGFYYMYSKLVPGKIINIKIRIFVSFILSLFILSILFGFYNSAPESSTLGARSFCFEEVLLYGFLSLLIIFIFCWRSSFPLTFRAYLTMGAVTSLVPGTLMQLACMYSPQHGLYFHYGPVLFGILCGLCASFIGKRRESN